ncbi:MAG: lipid-A-disaccharide synthase [Chitinophagaceae bacterium]|nr:lipid-A-disaccharide synthase [Chitinophagaceae bacterium]
MKYFIVTGEASGDLHASNLVKELKLLDNNFEAKAWGGSELQAQNVLITKNISDLAFMGFVEVLKNLKTILNNFSVIKKEILAYQPDVIILVDYPGFNLRLAKWAKLQNFKIIYYIAPQVWAWKENRVAQLKKYVDKLICILPFEKDFFAKKNMQVDYVGHPLLDVIKVDEKKFIDKKSIALLPGSRKQEIEKVLPVFVEMSNLYPDENFEVVLAKQIPNEFYASIIGNKNNIKINENGISSVLAKSKLALVTSGTATLETALYEVPQIVCYKGGNLSYQIAKRLVKVPYISLVNLIMGKKIVAELIQHDFNVQRLAEEINFLLQDEHVHQMKQEYKILKEKLGDGGASKRAAKLIWDELN